MRGVVVREPVPQLSVCRSPPVLSRRLWAQLCDDQIMAPEG